MKILDLPAFPSKINFVDKNNVVVGFDTHQDCCESFGWFFSDHFEYVDGQKTMSAAELKLDKYNFDPDFMHSYTEPGAESESTNVSFKLIKPRSKKPLYLHLYNHHNGYYGHGFTVDIGGISKFKGLLWNSLAR